MTSKIDDSYVNDAQFKAYAESNYSYNDAELLASLWEIDILDAKKTIGYKIINGLEHLLPEKIQGGTSDEYDLEALGMFVLSPYTYDDANALAQLWDTGVLDAKEIIGIKILNGDESLLPDEVRREEEPKGC